MIKHTGFKNLPATVLFLLTMLSACVYCKKSGLAWHVPESAIETLNPIAYSVESVTNGKKLFEQNCQQCHGYWGEGNGVVGLSLNKRPANLLRLAGKKAEGEFAWKIAEGRGEMPGFRKILSQDDIWNIVNFVQSLENEESPGAPLAQNESH